VHVVVRFPVEETDHDVTRGESLAVTELMLEHPFVKIAAESDVEGPRQASHDVDAVIAQVAHEGMIAEGGFR